MYCNWHALNKSIKVSLVSYKKQLKFVLQSGLFFNNKNNKVNIFLTVANTG